MKTIQISIIACILLLLCSCSKQDYLKVIPDDATVVASINLRALAEKSDFAHSKLMGLAQENLSGLTGGASDRQMKKYWDDPMATGIDFSQPFYVFMTPERMVGIVLKVKDDGDLDDFFSWLHKQGTASAVTKKSGVRCGNLDGIHFSFNPSTLLLLMREGQSAAALQPVALRLMEQDEDHSFLSTEAYGKMADADGQDIVAFTSYGAMPKDILEPLRQSLSFSPDDLAFVSSLDFVNGAAVLKTSWWGRTAKVQKLLEEGGEGLCRLKGTFVDEQPDDFFAWVGLGLKGDKALKQMKANPQAKELLFLLERALDIEQMLQAVDGDVAFSLPLSVLNAGKREGMSALDFTVQAQMKSTQFMDDVDDWMPSLRDYGFSMQPVGKEAYQLTMDDLRLNWGVDGKTLYFATPQAYQQLRSAQKGSVLQGYKSEIEKSKLFVYLNVRDAAGLMVPMIGVNLAGLKAVTMQMAENDAMTIRVEMENQATNFLRQLFE